MANTNSPSGLSPVRSGDGNVWNQQATLYWIKSDDTSQYNIGDLVKLAEGIDVGGTTGLGVTWAPKISKAAAGDATVGVLVGVMTDPNALQTINIPGTKTHDYAVMVVDDPGTVFEMTDDGITTGNLVTTAVGQNCNFTVTNPTAPSPVSATVILSSSIATTTTLPLKIIGVKQIENQTIGAYTRWLVRINNHQFVGTGTVGV